jgi:adhesin/invasin
MKKYLVLLLSVFVISSATADTSDIKNNFFNSLGNLFDGKFENTDISIKSTEETKPEFSIETFKPLSEDENGLSFFQGSFYAHDGTRETINLGFGKRIFSNDKNMMYGLNAFYDHELDYDHSRASLGGEIKSSFLELNHNQYFSNSDSRTGKNEIAEEVLDGYDLELGLQVPYIPSATIYTKTFEFDANGGNDFEGMEYSTKLEVPNSGLTVEAGHTDYDNHNDEWFFKLNFSISKVNKDRSFISNEMFEKVDITDQKYEKVRRDNIMVKGGADFTVKAGGF